MFNRIVVGMDRAQGGRDAVALAEALAGPHAEIVLLHAFPHDHGVGLAAVGADYAELMRDDAREMLDVVAAHDARLRPLVTGDWSPGRALHTAAREEHADLIVVGSAHRGPIGRVLAGDVSRAALHGAPCAVAVAPRGYAGRPEHAIASVAVGVDGTPESDVALSVAADLAADLGAVLRLVTAVPTPVGVASYGFVYDWVALQDEERRAAQTRLDDASARLGVATETEVVDGAAGPALETASERAGLVVCGSRGWGTSRAVVLGSTSDRLVHHAHSPVLVVPRPDAG